jgi:hypothetical protein
MDPDKRVRVVCPMIRRTLLNTSIRNIDRSSTMIRLAGVVNGAGASSFAVDEFCLAEGWELLYLALHPEMNGDVVLRKI